MSELVYHRPADDWLECLPLGNGSIGAMVDGGFDALRISLNHETGWSGTPESEHRRKVTPEDAAAAIRDARLRVAAGDPRAAAESLKVLQAPYSQAFLPLGTAIWRRSVPHDHYSRSLDLATATHRVAARGFTERMAVSAPHKILIVETSGAATLEFVSDHEVFEHTESGEISRWLIRFPQDVPPHFEEGYPSYTPASSPGTTVEAAVVAREIAAEHGGTVLLMAVATTFTSLGRPLRSISEAEDEAARHIALASTVSFDTIFAEAEGEHARLFSRCSLHLSGSDETRSRPVSDRLATAFARDDHPLAGDPALAELVFDLGRYLAITGSRPGGLPLTLQGIWNASMRPPWSSNYTLNINTQMNYWAAHSTNMSEVATPLREFVQALSAAGESTARRLYSTPGWVAHHNSDLWLFSSPVGDGHGEAKWSQWPMSALWLVRSVYDAVAFHDDADEAETIYNVVRGAVEFALDWHHQDADGEWSTSPSTSPENTFRDAAGRDAAIDAFSEMDFQLLHDALTIMVELAERTGRYDDPIAVSARQRLRSLSDQPHLAADGRVREWSEDRIEVDAGHRHVSHLYGLYPGPGRWNDASRKAATRTLEARGDESTGWSLMWKTALWARLERTDKVSDLLALMFREAGALVGDEAGGLYPNLFAAHPPFQIDANLAFPGVIAECLLQSHRDIALLPALPPELPTGRVRGLVARPGIEVDIDWRDGELVTASFRNAGPRRNMVVRWGTHEIRVDLGRELTVDASSFRDGA